MELSGVAPRIGVGIDDDVNDAVIRLANLNEVERKGRVVDIDR